MSYFTPIDKVQKKYIKGVY